MTAGESAERIILKRPPILVILGDRTANEILEAALLAHRAQFATIEKIYFEQEKFLSQDVPRLSANTDDIFFHAGMANEAVKRNVVEACLSIGWKAQSVIHPTAVIAPSATIHPGVFVGPLAVISSQAIVEQHCIVHLHASVGHDARIGEYSAILPGARISGNVVIGQRSLIGSNAFVAAGKTIGNDCRVDALSYVQQDLADGYMLSPRYPKALKRVGMGEARG